MQSSSIKIAFIGSTGKCGKYVLNHLLQSGFACKLLLRKPQKLEHVNTPVDIVQGDVRDYHAVHNLLQGCNMVISTLSQPTGEAVPVFSAAARNIIQAMQQHNIQRYIVIAGLNVDVPGDTKGAAATYGTEWMYKNYPVTTADRQAEFVELVKSNIGWTLVRLPLIEQTTQAPQTIVNLHNCPGSAISATSLAHFITNQLFNGAFIRQAPFIANALKL